MNTTRNVVSNMTLRPSFEDHGSSLRCVVVHPHWDPAYGNLSCAYDRLNVHFPPKLNCPEKQAIWDSQVRLAAETEAMAAAAHYSSKQSDLGSSNFTFFNALGSEGESE